MEQKVDDAHLKQQEDQNQRFILWLSALPFREQHVAILESVQTGTGGWFIKHETLQSWLEGKIDMLWCPGIREFLHTLGLYTDANSFSVSWCWKNTTNVSNIPTESE